MFTGRTDAEAEAPLLRPAPAFPRHPELPRATLTVSADLHRDSVGGKAASSLSGVR